MAKTGYGNLRTKVSINKSQRNKGQTKDLSKKRCLNELHNNSSGLKMELI